MVNEITVYNSWLKYTGVLQDRGYKPTTYDKLSDDKKFLCIKISKIINDLNVDVDFFFNSTVRKKETSFYDLKYFTSLAAIKSCKTHKKEIIYTIPDDTFNIDELKKSYKFIVNICKENSTNELNDYIHIQDKLYNRFILDLKYNKVSIYTLFEFKDFIYTFKNFDRNLMDFILNDININVINELYTKYVNSKKLKKINKKLFKKINERLKNYE